MQEQQKVSQKNLKQKVLNETDYIKDKKLYIEYKTFRQEAAGVVNKFAKHFSNKKNVEAIKTNICALVDDLSSHAKTINETKESGVGRGILNVLFPLTIKAMNGKPKKK